MSDIGLPANMSKDDAYIQGMYDGQNEFMDGLCRILDEHENCSYYDHCVALRDFRDLRDRWGNLLDNKMRAMQGEVSHE